MRLTEKGRLGEDLVLGSRAWLKTWSTCQDDRKHPGVCGQQVAGQGGREVLSDDQQHRVSS